MKYEKPTFTVPMPGRDVDWPFPSADRYDVEKPLDPEVPPCGECGSPIGEGIPHLDKRDVEARPRRPSKRVCFGKVIVR